MSIVESKLVKKAPVEEEKKAQELNKVEAMLKSKPQGTNEEIVRRW